MVLKIALGSVNTTLEPPADWHSSRGTQSASSGFSHSTGLSL
jgi:hypothetical protein